MESGTKRYHLITHRDAPQGCIYTLFLEQTYHGDYILYLAPSFCVPSLLSTETMATLIQVKKDTPTSD